MFFHFLIAFTLFHSISCQISCYDCSEIHDTYSYIVTADNIPARLDGCSIKTNQDMCFITVKWFLNVNSTNIHVGGESRKMRSSFTQDLLVVDIAMSGIEPNQQLHHTLNYFCSTDKCNHIHVLKRLLQSLIVRDQFNDIKGLLKPVEPFNTHACSFASNQTAEDCNIPTVTDPNSCKQCAAEFFHDGKTSEICTGCFADEVRNQMLTREIQFNMTDRTYIDVSAVNCQVQNCNTPETGHLIREKSTIDFDFIKFFNSGTKPVVISFFNQTIFTILILVIKTFS